VLFFRRFRCVLVSLGYRLLFYGYVGFFWRKRFAFGLFRLRLFLFDLRYRRPRLHRRLGFILLKLFRSDRFELFAFGHQFLFFRLALVLDGGIFGHLRPLLERHLDAVLLGLLFYHNFRGVIAQQQKEKEQQKMEHQSYKKSGG